MPATSRATVVTPPAAAASSSGMARILTTRAQDRAAAVDHCLRAARRRSVRRDPALPDQQRARLVEPGRGVDQPHTDETAECSSRDCRPIELSV